MAEPQTYKAFIKIPDSVRQIMLKGERVFCRADGKWITDYRNMMVIGLAPGGIAKVWQIVFHRDGVMGTWRARIDAFAVRRPAAARAARGGRKPARR